MCQIQIEKNEDKLIDSDILMMAENSFNSIIEQVQVSKLNFQIQLSPYSAVISLKKTFLKDQNGRYVTPKLSAGNTVSSIKEDVIPFVKYETLEADYLQALNKIKVLEKQLEIKEEHAININENQNVNTKCTKEPCNEQNVVFSSTVKEQNLKDDDNLVQTIICKKELEDNVTGIDPKNKYALSITSTSPSSPSNEHFLPSKQNKNKDDICQHSPQCVRRQPLPPPLPRITFLKDNDSDYHKHMMDWRFGVPGRYGGHEDCLRIENKNYGCSDCKYFKRFGERLGYPDINPWTYRKFLDPSEEAEMFPPCHKMN